MSGAGRAPNETKLFCEVTEGVHAYGVANHRHLPEIEQELSTAVGEFGIVLHDRLLIALSSLLGSDIKVTFTPHLMPMSRGMLSTVYVEMEEGVTAEILKTSISNFYADETFVKVLSGGIVPQTRHVRGSNYNLINVFDDRTPGRAIILSVIDNLVKGASGQALQNMNLLMEEEETCGLMQQPLFP